MYTEDVLSLDELSLDELSSLEVLLDELLSAVHSVLLDYVLVVTLVVLACVVEADATLVC